MDPLAERLRMLARAVGLERDAEIAFHRHEMATLSGEERQRRGRALMGLRALPGGRALGERSLTVLRPGSNTAAPGRTAISRGDLVRLSLEAAPEREIAIATVWSLGATITVATSRPPNCGREPLRLDLWSQDVTFQRMEAALERFGGPPGRRWRERLFEPAPRWRPLEPGSHPPQDLDTAQRAAWKRAVTARDWSLVQGPPGTGKTTTATAIAHTRIAAGDRVLLTGPTNVAADNLALGLLRRGREGLVRVGHPARAHEDLQPFLLDALVDQAGGARLAALRTKMRLAFSARAEGLRPAPRWRRGLDDATILRLARQGEGLRGVEPAAMREMAVWIKGQHSGGRLLEELRAEEERLAGVVLDGAEAVIATCSTVGSDILSGRQFDLCIMDEAAQAPLPLALIPVLASARVVLVGDPRQLPPLVRDEDARALGLADTLYEDLALLRPDAVSLLSIQYRMRDEIMAYSNRRWYGSLLRAAPEAAARAFPALAEGSGDPLDEALEPVALVGLDTAGACPEEMEPGETSWRNPGEAKVVERLVRRLLARGLPAAALGVIVPYRAQRKRLRQALEDTKVEVATVDGFQGREKEVIVLGLVRSNSRGNVGFLLDDRRLNVAVTRARTRLFVVGDRATTERSPLYRDLWATVERLGKVLPAPPG